MGKTLGYGEITVANMTEPFTVMLTNEAQQFATDSNRKVTSAQSYYTDIIVIRGSQERTDYTIGNITSSSGITVSKSSKRVTFSVSAGATIRADTGVIEIPITLDGQTVKKQFSWSCGKQGPQGVQGNDGNSFAWNMLSETNCGKKHWGTESSGGKYSVEDFITEDNINAVKLICTEGISTSNWSYVLFKDIKMLKQLKPSTKYTLSYDIKANRSGAISHSICKGDVSNFCTNTVVVNNIIGNETWQHISVVLTTNDLKTTPTNEILYLGRNALSKVGYSIIKNLKLVEGDINTPWSPSQSDIEGKGVVETIQYYLATSQASGVTSSTSGWSTDITTQKLTADKKYLWNCYQTKYSDGTSEPISTPKVIGVYGDKGQNAKNLSITPSSQYFKSTDGGKTFAPNAITIKPTIQGEISFGKWQYSIDGGVSFTDVVSGQKGLTISNNVLTVSKDSSLYSDAVTMVTFRAVANDSSFYDTCSIAKIYDVSDIEIGGRNLLLNSDKEYVMGFGIPNTTWTDGYAYIGLPTTRINGEILPQNNAFLLHPEAGKTYTQTIWIETDADVIDLNAAQVSWFTGKYGHVLVAAKIIKLADNSYKLTSTHTVTKEDSDIRLFDIMFLFSALDISNSGTYLKFGKLKVEQGNVSTDWTPATEDVQTAILSTKSEISDVSLKVDKNKQAIEQRVEKTTYQQDLNLVKGDISKANEGLNKWRYEIYPKSLFASEYQGKSTMDVFAKNTNLTPSQSVLINDTDFGKSWAYGDNYIGYALTFVKFSAAKSIAITFKHDDGAHLYLNGKLIGGDDTCNTGSGESLTLSFIQGWNCLEVVLNEKSGGEYIGLGTTISAISECQLMNCYYGTPVARQSHITNQLVENTTNIDGVSGSVQKVMSTVGGSSKIDEFVNNYSTWKKKVDGIETRVGKTYVTKNDFDGLEIGGVNLFVKSTASIGWWISDTGVLNANGGWGYSDYINVSGMKNYIASGFTNLGISPATCFYDSNKTFISGVQSTNQNSQDSKRKTLPIPSNAKYMRFSFMRVDIDTLKIEQGTKATAYSPAPEDDEINGQNLVSNLPSNWEQGTVTEGSTTGTTYANTKSSSAGSVRPKELIPVSGNITISTAYSNQSKKPIRHWIAAYDVNKNYLGNNYVSNAWNSFPRTLNMKDAKYIAIMVGYTDSSAITPSDISQICLKIERGTSATPFTLAPEDVNGKIVNVETIANQTADKFEWIVKGGDSSSNFTLTDRVADLVAERINFKGLVTFSGLSTDAKNEIGKVAQSKVDGLEVGGRNLIINSNLSRTLTNVTNDGCSNMTVVSDSVYGHALKFTAVNQRRVFWATSNVWVKDKTYTVSFVAKSSVTGQKIRPSRSTADWGDDITLTTSYARYTTKITSLDTNAGGTLSFSCTNAVGDITITNVKLEVGNKATDWTPAPEDVSQDATNKASQALTDAKNYSSNAVNWVTNNGSSTTSLNSMVKKWTDGAVSDTTQINGGWIKANTITASKIALADFTNYSQLTRDTADAYGFTVTDDTDGTWFSTKNIKRDQFISEIFPCNGGESYLIEYDISTNAKGANNSTDTKNYIGVAIGVYGYTGTVGSNGLPNKATNIWYADRITGSETAPSIHVKTTITTSTATKQFRVFLQSNGYYFEGTTKIRNLSVRRMYGGTLIVDGSITADKIATDAIKSRNYISSGGTQGSFLNLSDGSFQSPNLSWDSNGNLIAKNANLSGEITATKGTIGGWSIISNSFFTKYNSSIDSYGTGISGDNNRYVLWAGEKNNAYGVNRNSDTPTDATLRIWRNGAIEIQGNDSTTSGIGHLYKILIQAGRIKVGIDDHYIGSICGSDTTLDNQVINQHVSLTAHKGYGWSILHTNDSGNLICDIKRDPNTNGIKFFDDLLISSGGNQIQLNANSQGSIELYGNTPFIDFHCGYSDADYTSRIIANGSNSLNITGNLWVDTDIHAGSWLYASEVHSGGAVVIASNSESYYWAHGYQMARGTSWGGVCIGDDSQGLRLYGTSIWASHSISTSDENLKENFTTLDQYEDFYMNLNPIGFNYIGDYDGKKTHFGFGAHKTEDILESEGYDSDKFAVVTHRPLVQEDIEKRFGKDVEVDIETEYGVSYTEFIALNTHMIQKTRKELAKVKQEKADLEARLQVIEAKLGL